MSYLRPTQPRASTREEAVVGVAGIPRPINDLGFPRTLNVETRGVDTVGKGKDELEVKVIVEGVRIVDNDVGEGGKTNNV